MKMNVRTYISTSSDEYGCGLLSSVTSDCGLACAMSARSSILSSYSDRGALRYDRSTHRFGRRNVEIPRNTRDHRAT